MSGCDRREPQFRVRVRCNQLAQELLRSPVLPSQAHLRWGKADALGAFAPGAGTLAVGTLPAIQAKLHTREEPLLVAVALGRRPQPTDDDEIARGIPKRSLGNVHRWLRTRRAMPDIITDVEALRFIEGEDDASDARLVTRQSKAKSPLHTKPSILQM